MNAPGRRLHRLHGHLEGFWSVDVSTNCRLTSQFEGEDAVLVGYQHYHSGVLECAYIILRIQAACYGSIWDRYLSPKPPNILM